MLQSIRDKSQGWIAWFIIIFLCLGFIVWGFSSYFHLGQSDTIAVVDGHEISRSQLQQTFQRLRRQEQMRLGANYATQATLDNQLHQQAFNTLLFDQLLYRQLSKLGFVVSDLQAKALIQAIPAFQQDGQFSQQRYLGLLGAQGDTPESFLRQIKTQLINQQLRAAFEDGSFVLPNEVSEFINFALQTRDIRYATISAQQFANQVTVNDSMIERFYQQHSSLFSLPETVRIDYITLSLADLAKQTVVLPQEVDAYYQTHQQQYTTPRSFQVSYILLRVAADADQTADDKVKQQADELVAKLRQGADFAKLAKQFSQDKLTAVKGGVLAGYTPGVLGAAFDNAVHKLQAGEVSDPVKTQYGYEIIKLRQVKPAVVQAFSEVKQQIIDSLKKQQAEEKFTADNELLASLTYENPDSLAKASQALNLPIKQSEVFTRQGLKTGIAENPSIIQAAFSDDVLQNGNNSDVITLAQDTVAVIRVAKHTEKRVQPLTDVRDDIRKKLIEQDSRARAKALGGQLLKQLDSGVDPTKLENKSIKWISTTVKRNSQNINAAVADYAFTLPIPSQQQPSYGGLVLDSGDYVLLQVKAVTPGKLAETDRLRRERYQKHLMQLVANYDYQQFLADIFKKADIKIKDPQLHNPLKR